MVYLRLIRWSLKRLNNRTELEREEAIRSLEENQSSPNRGGECCNESENPRYSFTVEVRVIGFSFKKIVKLNSGSSLGQVARISNPSPTRFSARLGF